MTKRIPLLLLCACLVSLATATMAMGAACYTPWVSTTAYNGGATVSYASVNYTANWWTQGNEPDKNNGSSGSGQPWTSNGACGGGATATATATATKTATATATKTATGTATKTATATATKTATATATKTATATATKTATATATKTATATATATKTATATATATSTGTGSCSVAAWSSTTVYNGGNQASYGGFVWTASYWTQNNTPAAGGSGPWNLTGYCGTAPGTASSRLFAPYVDVTMGYNLTSNASATGGHYTLAFVQALGGACTASWAGVTPLGNLYGSDITSLRAAGGDVVVSFGGAAGTELSSACGSASAAQAQYQSVVSMFSLKRVDFDIEGGGVGSYALRDSAVAGLQSANSGLQVSYTLAALNNGLPSQQVSIVQDAIAKGVKLSTVNIMAMDFGSSYDNGGQMEVAALYGAFSTAYELQGLISGLSFKSAAQMTGITPMIGQNDTSSEVFTISNAQQLVSDAHTYGFGFLSFWSATRDYACPGGATGSPASGSCSGVSSSSQQYSGIFKSF